MAGGQAVTITMGITTVGLVIQHQIMAGIMGLIMVVTMAITMATDTITITTDIIHTDTTIDITATTDIEEIHTIRQTIEVEGQLITTLELISQDKQSERTIPPQDVKRKPPQEVSVNTKLQVEIQEIELLEEER